MNHLQKHITLKHLLIRQNKMIGIQFYPDKVIQALIKELPNPKWSEEFSLVYIENTTKNLDLIFEKFKGVTWINCNYFFEKKIIAKNNFPNINHYRKRIPKEGLKYIPEEYLTKLELKGYALNTCKVYINMFEQFINFYSYIEIHNLGEKNIRDYLKQIIHDGKSNSYINQSINSIKFYYEVVLGMPNRFYSIERPIKKEKLPTVLSKQEIITMIDNTSNLKHKCIISLLYSAGLRKSELLNLKISDIDSKRMVIIVKQSKGNTDRLTLLSNTILNNLRKYYKIFNPKTYLFENPNGSQYSRTSIDKIVKKAAHKSNILKNVTPQTLRHSFATHLLENGVNLRYIQNILGHKSSKTTEIYTRVATNHLMVIKNPLDL